MNIWYLNPYAGGPGVGSAWRAYYLCREFNRAGNDATVITASYHHMLDSELEQPARRDVEGVRYVTVFARRYRGNGIGRILNMFEYAVGIVRLPKLVPDVLERPDAIIVSSPHPFAFVPAWVTSRRYKCKLVFEVRDLWPLSIRLILGVPSWHPLVLACSFLERFAYKTSDVVASLLPGADIYIKKIGLAPKRFYWAPNGVVGVDDEPKKTLLSKTAEIAALKLQSWKDDGRCVLVYAGTIGPPNGVDILVDALKLIQTNSPNVKLGVLIIGKGISAQYISQRVRSLQLDNVLVSPPVPRSEAVQLISSADIAYAGGRSHDELYQYGTSVNKVMDYMMTGIPVIFPHMAYRGPVGESGAGIQLDHGTPETVAEAISSLAEMPAAARHEMGERGRSYVREHFMWPEIAAGYIDVLAGRAPAARPSRTNS